MMLGPRRPVLSWMLEIFRAMAMSGPSTTCSEHYISSLYVYGMWWILCESDKEQRSFFTFFWQNRDLEKMHITLETHNPIPLTCVSLLCLSGSLSKLSAYIRMVAPIPPPLPLIRNTRRAASLKMILSPCIETWFQIHIIVHVCVSHRIRYEIRTKRNKMKLKSEKDKPTHLVGMQYVNIH